MGRFYKLSWRSNELAQFVILRLVCRYEKVNAISGLENVQKPFLSIFSENKSTEHVK